MDIVVRKQTVYVSPANVLLVEIEHRDVGVILENHAGDDFVAQMQVFSGAVLFDIFAHFYNFACALMAEDERDEIERIALKFVRIGTADAASLYFDKDIVVADFGKRILLDFIFLLLDQHCDARRFGNRSPGRGRRRGCRSLCAARHALENFANDIFNILIVYIHSRLLFVSEYTSCRSLRTCGAL